MSQLLSLPSFITSALYIILAVLVLLLMVTIHELGHYTAGKLLKFKITEFAVGFGKKLWSKKTKSGEVFSLRLFPLGGFCAFEGDDDKGEGGPDSFNKQAPWKRLIVFFAGAFFNLVSAIIFSAIFLTFYGYADRIQVTEVDKNLIPQTEYYQDKPERWLMPGDIIIGVNGERTNFVYDVYFKDIIVDFEPDEEFFNVLVIREGKEVTLKVRTSYGEPLKSKQEMIGGTNTTLFAINGTDYLFKVVPVQKGGYSLINVETNAKYSSDKNGLFIIGDVRLQYSEVLGEDSEIIPTLSLARIGITTQFYRYGFFEALGQAFPFAFGWAWKVLVILFSLITGGIGLSSVGGPITTITTMASVTQMNFANFFLLLPLIAANLAVFNLLPFPALDGGHMFFTTLEAIFKKPVPSRKVQGYIHFFGLIFLMGFVILVDILHFLL